MESHFDEAYAAGALAFLEREGFRIEPGLTADELHTVEDAVRAPLPPELALLLSVGLPAGQGFRDWRGAPYAAAESDRAWVARAFTFDIKHDQWWYDGWGPRPAEVTEAQHVALEHLAQLPPLIGVNGHRLMTTEPRGYGNPVLSVYQAVDSIYYGYDLADYLYREFGVPRPSWAASVPPRVPHWGDLFDLLSERD